jgi:predicted nucleic acid-binding protein
MKADQALIGAKRLLLDTCAISSILYDEPTALQPWAVMQFAVANDIQMLVSPLTLMEVLAKADLTQVETKRAAEFCLATEGIEFMPINFDDIFAIRVGFFRRTTGVKLPDCIQFACAETLNCEAILTNDAQYARHPSVRCLLYADIDI